METTNQTNPENQQASAPAASKQAASAPAVQTDNPAAANPAPPKAAAPERLEWERLDDEPPHIYRIFRLWLDIGPSRSYSKIADKSGFNKKTIYNWSKKYNWLGRAECFDKNKYHELKDAVMEFNSDEIKLNVENSMKITNMANSLMTSIVDALRTFDVNYYNRDQILRFRYLILACRAVRQLKSVISFAPFSQGNNDFMFEGALMNYFEKTEAEKNQTKIKGYSSPDRKITDKFMETMVSELKKNRGEKITRHYPEFGDL